MQKKAYLVLADGQVFEGVSFGAEGQKVGELVFNTSMTGYQEILTDPSYAKQIVLLTTSHVGNTGWNDEDMESSRSWVSGLVVRDYVEEDEHFRAKISLANWLRINNIVAIAGLDTRELTLYLRDNGACGACLTTDEDNLLEAKRLAKSFKMTGEELASEVSVQTVQRWDSGLGAWASKSLPLNYHVVAYDYGVKYSILKILVDLGCYLTLVPAKTSAEEVLAFKPDGVFLSNGPGDPAVCDFAIAATKTFLQQKIPLFGICLGFQILALTLGAKSVKMKFGHHGANHPVIEVKEPNRIFITSQNHGFAIEEKTLPQDIEITHVSLFDQSLQGIRHKKLPAFGFQGHPEASPGPHDICLMFETFIEIMEERRRIR
ncbi:MAG: carbamoyl phosphate synthase small subunit [Legionellales bacterium RIFCSPHIGHO2_12_FULL_37_14]|nr:MAG: carbamoyl phosphate synthase small subunit [Legionellales bacterium RIFCSPHIGHO2_12_FULL_37_14]